MEAAPGQASYRALLRHPGMRPLLAGIALGRVATGMWSVTLVLLVVLRYRSPALAGLAIFLSLAPGLMASPFAGAILDRRGRRTLVLFDYLVATAALLTTACTSSLGILPVPLLLLLVTISGLTQPLSTTGLRTLFPLLLPPALWDRGNGLDGALYTVAGVVGPGLAGGLISLADPEVAIAVAATLYLGGAISTAFLHDPALERAPAASFVGDAISGVVYVLRNPSLRGLLLCFSISNLSWGAFNVALPVLVTRDLHSTAAVVGLLLALFSAVDLVATLSIGRLDIETQGRRLLVAGCLGLAVSRALLGIAPTIAVAAVIVAVSGGFMGCMQVPLYSLRQRRTSRPWFGRVFAVHSSLTYAGMPLGAALAGPLVTSSTELALAAGSVAAVIGALSVGLIPRSTPARS